MGGIRPTAATASEGRAPPNPARTHNKRRRVRATIARCQAAPTSARGSRRHPSNRSNHGFLQSIIFFPWRSLAGSWSGSSPSDSSCRIFRDRSATLHECAVGRPVVPPRDSGARTARPGQQRPAANRDTRSFPHTTRPTKSPTAPRQGNLLSAATRSWREFRQSLAQLSPPPPANPRWHTPRAGGDSVESGKAPLA